MDPKEPSFKENTHVYITPHKQVKTMHFPTLTELLIFIPQLNVIMTESRLTKLRQNILTQLNKKKHNDIDKI